MVMSGGQPVSQEEMLVGDSDGEGEGRGSVLVVDLLTQPPPKKKLLESPFW